MKLHDLRPAEGSRTPRTRVGRGIAAGKGKTAGRGTKGQKARAGGSIPPWFEGGQTPLHVRIPKLRGFKNRFKLQYEVVNVGDIGAAAERGAFEAEAATGEAKSKGKAKTGGSQITINQDILRAVGLVRTLDKPLKILGGGELGSSLFVVADAFTASARAKIEAAGGSVNVLEIPTRSTPAIGVEPDGSKPAAKAPKARPSTAGGAVAAVAGEAVAAVADEPAASAATTPADAPAADTAPSDDVQATAEDAEATSDADEAVPDAAEATSDPIDATSDTAEVTGQPTSDDAETASGDDV
jgi:large subunit ribosomal protein L15